TVDRLGCRAQSSVHVSLAQHAAGWRGTNRIGEAHRLSLGRRLRRTPGLSRVFSAWPHRTRRSRQGHARHAAEQVARRRARGSHRSAQLAAPAAVRNWQAARRCPCRMAFGHEQAAAAPRPYRLRPPHGPNTTASVNHVLTLSSPLYEVTTTHASLSLSCFIANGGSSWVRVCAIEQKSSGTAALCRPSPL